MNRQQTLFSEDELKRIDAEYADWEQNEVASFLARAPERRSEFRTGSGQSVQRTYTPLDMQATPWDDLGLPGRYALLIDFAAIGALLWALIVTLRIWRARRDE